MFSNLCCCANDPSTNLNSPEIKPNPFLFCMYLQKGDAILMPADFSKPGRKPAYREKNITTLIYFILSRQVAKYDNPVNPENFSVSVKISAFDNLPGLLVEAIHKCEKLGNNNV